MQGTSKIRQVIDLGRGLFITFEGPDGSGKTTQVRLFGENLKKLGFEVTTTREPGGTRISDAIRSILLDAQNTMMAPMTEAMLYAAARCQHVREVIRPAVEAGQIVICDRFYDSSVAYQAFGRGLGEEDIIKLNAFALEGLVPDLTFLLDVDAVRGLARVGGRAKKDRLENEAVAFHEMVRNAFLTIAGREPKRVKVVDAARNIKDVEAEIMRIFNISCVI